MCGITGIVDFSNSNSVTQPILKKMKRWEGQKEESLKQGIEIAVEMYDDLKNNINGLQISAPFGNIETVKEIINLSGINL